MKQQKSKKPKGWLGATPFGIHLKLRLVYHLQLGLSNGLLNGLE